MAQPDMYHQTKQPLTCLHTAKLDILEIAYFHNLLATDVFTRMGNTSWLFALVATIFVV